MEILIIAIVITVFLWAATARSGQVTRMTSSGIAAGVWAPA